MASQTHRARSPNAQMNAARSPELAAVLEMRLAANDPGAAIQKWEDQLIRAAAKDRPTVAVEGAGLLSLFAKNHQDVDMARRVLTALALEAQHADHRTDLWNELGNAYTNLGQLTDDDDLVTKALKAFDNALQLTGTGAGEEGFYHRVAINKAIALIQRAELVPAERHDLDEANRLLTQALEVLPEDGPFAAHDRPRATEALGRLRFLQGETTQATELLHEAASLMPTAQDRARLWLEWGNFIRASQPGTDALAAALSRYKEALALCSSTQAPLLWAQIHYAIGTTIYGLATISGTAAALELKEAECAFNQALRVCRRENAPSLFGDIHAMRCMTLIQMSAHEGMPKIAMEVLESYNNGAASFDRMKKRNEITNEFMVQLNKFIAQVQEYMKNNRQVNIFNSLKKIVRSNNITKEEWDESTSLLRDDFAPSLVSRDSNEALEQEGAISPSASLTPWVERTGGIPDNRRHGASIAELTLMAREEPPLELPKKAPMLWADQKNTEKNPLLFIETHYKPWIGKGLTTNIIRNLDPILYKEMSNYFFNNKKGKKPIPEGFPLPSLSNSNDLWVEKITATLGRPPNLEDVHELQRRAALLRRKVQDQESGR